MAQTPGAPARRRFLGYLAASPLAAWLGWPRTAMTRVPLTPGPEARATAGAAASGPPRSVFAYEELARAHLGTEAYGYAAGGSDDEKTLRANRTAIDAIQVRARRLVDVSRVDLSTSVFGQSMPSPVILAPVGFQQVFHADGELATARAAAQTEHVMIASSVSGAAVGEIAAAAGQPPWFQLYPTPDRGITRALLARAEAAGCGVVALTVDTPVIGNRERHGDYLARMLRGGAVRMGNYEGIRSDEPITDASMTWDMISWLRQNTSMQVIIKGIVRREDATRCVEHGAAGIVVSNHGGRQEESNRGTMACLPEVLQGAGGRIPVLIDGGFRRGTDVFKALALGARAVCVGRPFIWGLAASGADGVAAVLEIMDAELRLAMQLFGARNLGELNPDFLVP